MPTRRSNRLRAASAAQGVSATADVEQTAPSAVEVTAAASSRRARRLAQSGAPIVQPVTEPAPQTVVDQVANLTAAPVAVEDAPVIETVIPAVPDMAPVVDEAPVFDAAPAEESAPAVQSAPEAASAAEGIDAFAAASEAFGFAPVDSASSVPTADEPVTVGAAPTASHVVPRRARVVRRMATAGASLGVLGVAGLIAVSMTLPSTAVAAVKGVDKTSASLVAAEQSASTAVEEDEIQAYVASEGVQDESLERADQFSTISLAQVAAEAGIRFSSELYTNDPDAAIQWPYKVGVGMSYGYGPRSGRLHAGIDLVPGAGAPIQAIADGTVRKATESGGGYGVTVYIDHVIDGQVVTSHYSHMQYGSLRVKTGQKVKVGDIIGKTGNTGRSYGAHLHFEIIINGSTIDPLPWMNKNAGRYEY